MNEGSPTLMSGVPELVVLRLLTQHEMYGYEIARALKLGSQGALDLGEGVLYPALHALEARGLLRARSLQVDGRKRIYYAVTPRGRRRLERLIENWRRVSTGVELVLGATSYE